MTLLDRFLRIICFIAVASLPGTAWAQSDSSSGQKTPMPDKNTDQQAPPKDKASNSQPGSAPQTATPQQGANPYGQQTKRIFGIIPNYRSVSANTALPPDSTKEKFWLATQDSFDYSSFLFVGLLAGYGQATKNDPEFHQGAAGYGRYYWHLFVDQAIGNYFTEAIMPTLTHEDPRYYTLGKGSFFRRSGYAISRLFVTRNDRLERTFNLSEIVGNGAAAGISNLYYPPQERTFRKTAEKWGLQVGIDGVGNVLKEFWPDIDRAIFHGKY
jgi:hypothetical protein